MSPTSNLIVHVDINRYLQINPEEEDLRDAFEIHATTCPDCKEVQIATGTPFAICRPCSKTSFVTELF